MIQVHVHLFSVLRQNLPPGARGRATLALPKGSTVDDLITHLGITRQVHLIFVNDIQTQDRQQRLSDGDYVKLLPVMVGG